MPINHLDATFGIEIECILPPGATFQTAAAAVTAAGVRCVVESYNHARRTHWKVVTDGSVGARGAEFVSPVLRGEDGLRQAEIVGRALTEFGCTISQSCGLHVHVGVARAPLSLFKNLVRMYAAFEPVLDAMMPASRRLSANMYCRSMASCNLSALDRATTLEQVTRAAVTSSAGYSSYRYHKLNLTAYDRHQTVEFRQHSGTTDPVKIRRWTEICLRMVAAARQPDWRVGVQPARNSARPGSKNYRIGQMMLRPEGATGREVCDAMHWPSVSMPAQARVCGLTFTTQRMGREVRYFAVAATGGNGTEISIAGFVAAIGAAAADQDYIAQRTVRFGGRASAMAA